MVVLLGMLDDGLMSVLEPGVVVVLLAEPVVPMSVLVPGVVVLPAPIEVPLPVVVSVLGGIVLAVLLLVSLGVVVVEGSVLEVVDDELVPSSFLLHALSDRAAIRARAAHCAIGDLIIRELLEGLFRCDSREA
ncbi:MAG TPA: hypothetical protein VFM98_21010 [Ramlibacter sp.]|uniref:hypothetical protein n=1 Tax=Ramlibacter sp. TaxID=1917967 RepID=UPI002D8107ED|nr:hypothetical protein [Ramlibacter sp.]HET8748090.1 hypothetical protein [Ramlibacter sp.]